MKELFEKIRLATEKGDFTLAEKLRDELIETAPMAINEAIASAEMIEKAMSDAVDKDHLSIWPELYENLSTAEKNCLFHSMQKYVLPEKRMLLQYGSLNNKLFFIEKGRVTACLPQEGNKLKIIAQLGRGDVLGEYTFATLALCSATAVTTSSVEIRCLDGDMAESWEKKHPGLYNKVLEFCQRHGRIDLISERQEQQTHTHPRFPVNGRVKAVLLDQDNQKTEVSFSGEMAEISRSGTSFSIHCKKRETVKQLLTRSFAMSFSLDNQGKSADFSATGRVVRVSFLLYNDYLLHIGFHTPLSENLISRIVP